MRQRHGRRNPYTINAHLPLPDPVPREQSLGALLEILTGAEQPDDHAEPTVDAATP